MPDPCALMAFLEIRILHEFKSGNMVFRVSIKFKVKKLIFV